MFLRLDEEQNPVTLIQPDGVFGTGLRRIGARRDRRDDQRDRLELTIRIHLERDRWKLDIDVYGVTLPGNSCTESDRRRKGLSATHNRASEKPRPKGILGDLDWLEDESAADLSCLAGGHGLRHSLFYGATQDHKGWRVTPPTGQVTLRKQDHARQSEQQCTGRRQPPRLGGMQHRSHVFLLCPGTRAGGWPGRAFAALGKL